MAQSAGREELAWAAGLFDGEGTIGVRRNGPKATLRRIALSLGMSDLPVVCRFHRAIGGLGTCYQNLRQSKYPNAKPMHRVSCMSFENVQQVVILLWPWLSLPKRAQATASLRAWKQDRHFRHDQTYPRLCKRGHDLRETTRVTPAGSRWCGKCQSTSVREWRARQRLQEVAIS